MAEGAPSGGAMPLSQWLLLVLLALLWGGAYLLVAIALRELPPLTVALGRVGFAALVLIVVVRAMGLAWPRGLAGWVPFAGMSVFNNVIPFTATNYGQLEVPSGLTSVIIATTPLWTVLLSRAFLPGERVGGMRFAGILVGIAGVGVLFGPELLAGRHATLLGMALILCSAVSYGCAGVWGMRLRGVSPILSSCCQLMCSTAMLAVPVVLIDAPWRLAMPGPAAIGAVLVISLVSTAFAYTIFYRILAASGGTNAMLVTLLMPPLAILLGILILDESFSPRQLAGAALIAAALVVIDGRLPQAVFRRFLR